jgi:hypothetical protein
LVAVTTCADHKGKWGRRYRKGEKKRVGNEDRIRIGGCRNEFQERWKEQGERKGKEERYFGAP